MSLQANVAQHTESGGNRVKRFENNSRSSSRGGSSREFRGRGRGRRFTHAKPQCQLCGRIGHTVYKCYYRFDESFEGVSQQSMQAHCHQLQESSDLSSTNCHCCNHKGATVTPSGLQANMVSMIGKSVSNNNVWFPDSGATNHITNDLDGLCEVASYTGHQDRGHITGGAHT
ncbi:hypothetical protein ES288_D09G092600v1 [Gossypium darwinii]|uniref:CCHC-type domain-containing protein n=1 Tax=Gossypium darwinii TaxID=34276 RepID=A0A5D2BCJ7_GOSDA|nr:hypothetical protein ES288_D09G092600v1 [Gossypium darwinii]